MFDGNSHNNIGGSRTAHRFLCDGALSPGLPEASLQPK
jgi:hypothetical protein